MPPLPSVGGGGFRTEKETRIAARGTGLAMWGTGIETRRWRKWLEEVARAACSPSALSTAWLGLIFLM